MTSLIGQVCTRRPYPPIWDQMMAEGVLRAFGFDDSQLSVAKADWLDVPRSTKVEATGMISTRKPK